LIWQSSYAGQFQMMIDKIINGVPDHFLSNLVEPRGMRAPFSAVEMSACQFKELVLRLFQQKQRLLPLLNWFNLPQVQSPWPSRTLQS
jgi:hypothetical protein